MRNIRFNKKKIFDICMTIAIVSTVFIGICIDKNIINDIPDKIKINNDIRKDVMLYVFAAQVTVSTLGTGFISILGAIVNDKIYGIGISQYIMQERPLVFKHKRSIIIQLLLIIISYSLMALEKYNMLVSIFFISIIISCMMVWDIFMIFYGNEYIRKEIHQYILEVFKASKIKKNDKRKSILKGLKKDTLEAINNGDTTNIQDNLYLFVNILNEIYINNLYEEKNEQILEILQDDIAEVFNKMLKENDTNKNIIALENMQSLYNKYNKINNQHTQKIIQPLNVFNETSRYIFRAMANIVMFEPDDYGIIFSLEYDLYDAIYFKKVEIKEEEKMVPLNNTYLNIYSGRVYYELVNKASNNPKKLFYIKETLYNRIIELIEIYTFKKFENEKIEQLFIQLFQYTRVLIDNKENLVLDKTFFKMINSIDYEYKYKKEKNEYILIMFIYLYYLIKFESLADEELKNNCKSLIKTNKEQVKNFLLCSYDFKISNEFIEKAKIILNRWEIMPEEDAKCLIMDKAIEEFLIFFITQRNYNIDELTEEIRVLVKNKEYSMYKQINENKDIVENYKLFINMFYDKHILEEDDKSKIEMLKTTIINLYKEGEIKRSKHNVKTQEELYDFKQQLKNLCMENIEDSLKVFHKKILQENIFNATFNLPNINISTELMNLNTIRSTINSYSNNFFGIKFINLIRSQIIEKNSTNNESEFLQKLFDLNNNIDTNIDTLVGYKSIFYQGQNDLVYDFREFEENKFKIRVNGFNNCIIGIDSSKCYFKVKEIKVNIEEPNMDEIYKKAIMNNQEEYLYEVNKDIRLPFTKKELKQYIYDTKRIVKVEVEIEYAFESDIIGIGVFINNNLK